MEEAKNWYSRLVENKCKVDGATLTHLVPLLFEKRGFEMAHRLCIEAIDKSFLRGPNILQYAVDLLVRESKVELEKDIVGHGKTGRPPYDLVLPQAEQWLPHPKKQAE